MKADKVLLICLAAVFLVKFFAGFPLDNTTIPGGTDVAHFLTNTWYVATHGLTKWNYYWYGGFPFLRYYPPLAFLITGSLAKVLGVLLAYKFVNNLFLALTPLAFYLFIREFKLSKEKEIIALLTFSFIPIFAYFFVDGRYPTIINVFFTLLYWKFLKRSLDDQNLNRNQDRNLKNQKLKGRKLTIYNISIAALLLSLSLITHHTTTFLFIIASTAWAFIYKTNFETLKKLLAIGILTLALTAWWSAPFFLETITTEKSGLYLRAVGGIYVSDIISRLKTSVLQYYASSFEPYLLIGVAAFMSVLSLLALTKYKDKTTRDFVLLLVFIVLMILVIKYERSIVFASIPISFIAAEGLGVLKKKLRIVVSILFILLLAASYFLIRPQMFEVPEYPNIPKDGRVIFFPLGAEYKQNEMEMKNYYSVILSPMNGQENIRGWHDESQFVGKSASSKVSYLNDVGNPLNETKENYYNLLKAAYINYVVVNKNAPEIVNYFKNPKFKEIFSDEMFVAYEINPKATYVEVSGQPVQSSVEKNGDMIEINTTCQKGNIVVKESYHQMWQATINDSPQKVYFNDYGFMKLNSDFDGNCKIVLRFEDPEYYKLFYFISGITIIFIIFEVRRVMIIKQKMEEK